MKKLIFVMNILAIFMSIATLVPAQPQGWKETEISRFVPLPRPESIKITPPAADLPPKIAAFLGRWEGVCDLRSIKIVFIVEKISEKNAKIIHGWGSGLSLKPDYARVTAKVIPGPKIEYMGIGKATYIFEMDEGLKRINYQYEFGGKTIKATLEKVED